MVAVGSTVGNYEVLEQVGQGAMGTVWLARHPQIGKRVALKVIRPELSSDEDVLTRFFNEARAVTLIGHPNIVDVQDFGQTPGGESFIVMELLEGETLGDALRGGPLDIERAVRICVQLTEGLQAAHSRGIVHRDLKPDNVFLVRRPNGDEHVKILDFGLAKLSGPGALQHNTRTGTVLGTPHYMAPEAAEGSRHVDLRADIYGLGCILFQMVTGAVPFPGDGFGEVLVRHVRDAPPLPSRLRADLPPWVEKIILHTLAKKPDKRFASMADFGHALREPAAWGKDVDMEDLARATRLIPIVREPAVTPVPARPTPSGTPTVTASPAAPGAAGVPTVLTASAPRGVATVTSNPKSSSMPTRIAAAPRARAPRDPVALGLFTLAGLTLVGAIAWRLTHQREPGVAQPPALSAPVVMAPTVMAPTVMAPVVTARPDVVEPSSSPDLVKRVRPARGTRHVPKKKAHLEKDGALLAPTW